LFGSGRQIKLAICELLGARNSEIVEVEVEVEIWNGLPEAVISSSSLQTFRRQ